MGYDELRSKSQDVIGETYRKVGPHETPPPGMLLVAGKDPGIFTFTDVPFENVFEMVEALVDGFEPERWSLWTLSATEAGDETVTMQVTEGERDENWHCLVIRTASAAPTLAEWKRFRQAGLRCDRN